VGLLAALLSAVCSSSKDLVSKKLAFRLDGTASTFASFAFALPYYLVVLAILAALGEETFSYSLGFLAVLFLRSVTDAFAEGLKMHALAHGDLSVVTTFFSLSPLFLLVTSPLLTGDPLSLPGVFAVVLVVAGSLALVYRPSEKGWASQKKGIVLATGAAVFFSLNSCFDRLAMQGGTLLFGWLRFEQGTPVFSGFAMTLLSALFLCPFVLFRKDRRQAMRDDRAGLLVRGALEVAFMVSKLTALRYLPAPEVVGLLRLSVLISIVAGRVYFKEADFGRRLAAGALILAGWAVIAWLQWKGL
jgi:drug/metabolite transporter (DMT)-like permease